MFTVRHEGPVRWLTIENPRRRNAIPVDQWGRLAELLDEFGASDARVLVVTGAGEDFCSGADLGSDFTLGSAAEGYEAMTQAGAAAAALHRLPKPTVAAVDGVAFGAGLSLAIGCDVVIASERARFSVVFVRRGLAVDFAGTWLLPRLVGMARAKELALSGRTIGADEALEYGMVSRVVPAEELAAHAGEVAAELSAGAPLAQRLIKAGLDRSLEMSFEQALAYERRSQALLLSSRDAAEGLAAFVQKRDPHFEGR